MATIDDIIAQLQLSPDDRRQAQTMGLLAAGLGILGTPGGRVNPMVPIGQGGLLGLNVYNQMLGDARQGKADQLKMREFAQGMIDREEQRKRQAQMDAAARASTTPGYAPFGSEDREGNVIPMPGKPQGFDWQAYANRLAPINPQAALQVSQAMAKDTPIDKPKPENFTAASLAKFAKSRDFGDLVPIEKPVDQFSDPVEFRGQQWQRNLRTNQWEPKGAVPPQVNVNTNLPPIESEEQKEIGKGRGAAFVQIQTGAHKAGLQLNQLDAMERLLRGVDTSSATPIGMTVAGYARAAGLNLDPKLPAKQAADAISNKMALDARNTAEGGGMPGAMSDQDREFLKNMNPNVAQTPEGRAMLIEIQRRFAKRQQQLGKMAREYRARNKTFDEGFAEEAQAFANANPLFADLQTAAGVSQQSGWKAERVK